MLRRIFFLLFSVIFIYFTGCSTKGELKKASVIVPVTKVGTDVVVEAAPAPMSQPVVAPVTNAGGVVSAVPYAKDQKQDATLTVYYGTNRKPVDKNDHSKGYTNKRADNLFLGTCKVNVPKEHRYGEIKGSLFQKIIHANMKYGDITLGDIHRYNEKEYWSLLRSFFKHQDGKKEALIFIHGYNNSFQDSAIRSAQIGYDLQVKGAIAFYSWPSQNKLLGYSEDEASIGASEKYIKEFIVGFAQKSGAKVVNIIAHSMGNRGLVRVMNDISKDNKDIEFGQIILAAPDIDAELFHHIANAYKQQSLRTTLYVSPKDKALWSSQIKHDEPRAGLTRPVTVIDGIDTVKVDFGFELLKLGHGYAFEELKLLEDIKELLNNNTPPSKRKLLKKRETSNYEKYWLLNL